MADSILREYLNGIYEAEGDEEGVDAGSMFVSLLMTNTEGKRGLLGREDYALRVVDFILYATLVSGDGEPADPLGHDPLSKAQST